MARPVPFRRRVVNPVRFVALFAVFAGLNMTLPHFGCIGCYRSYSEGERSGYVVKFSRKGLALKSWEGSLHLAGGAAASSTGADSWDFTVRDTALVAKLEAASEKGTRVTLKYHQWLASPVTMETPYEVYEVLP